MSKKVFLETDEYDIFMFPVPATVLKGKKFLATVFPRKSVKNWVLSWMQRLHPCFDGRFLHDIRFYKEKGRVMALVTVAEKMQVASHLVRKNTAVYVYRPDKRRVFAGETSARSFLFSSVVVFALIMSVLSGFSLYSDNQLSVTTEKMAVEVLPNHDEPDVFVASTDDMTDIRLSEEDFALSFEKGPAEQKENERDESVDIDEFVNFDEPVKTEEFNQIMKTAESGTAAESYEIVDILVLQSVAQPEGVQPEVVQPEAAQADITVFPEYSDADEVWEDEEIFDIEFSDAPNINDTPFIDDFFPLLAEMGCHISAFRWQTEPFASVILSVEGCFPEEIYDCAVKLCDDISVSKNDNLPRLSFSSIQYTDNIPSFSVVLDYSRFETSASAENSALQRSVSEIHPVQSVFRKLIVNIGGSVISESMEPPFVSGVIPYDCWNDFSEEASRILSAKEVGGILSVSFEADYSGPDLLIGTKLQSVQNVSFSAIPRTFSIRESQVAISMTFSSERTSFFPVEDISVLFPEQEQLFVQPGEQKFASELENPISPEQALMPDIAASLSDIAFINMAEIGSVCMDGNLYVNFYRNDDGTIIKGEPYEKK